MKESTIVLINGLNFESIVMQAKKPVLVACMDLEFGCENQISVIKTVAEEQQSQVQFCLVEVDYQRRFMEKFLIPGTPTFLVFEKGMEKGQMMGETDSEALNNFLKQTLPNLYPV